MENIPWTPERVPGEVELAAWRAGAGEPLVCIHGITAQHRAFNALARHLGDEYELVGVDLRGRGDSDKPESGYGLEAHAKDIKRVLDHLGLESVVLVGHSMGAFVALQTALSYPGRVKALVLLDGGWPRPETSPEALTEEQEREAEETRKGLERAYSRLEMVFETPEDYLDFWFPGQGLTLDDLPPDLADYYRYDLGEVEGGYQPKASLAAAQEDAPGVTERAPTAGELRGVRSPVALVRPTAGFFPDAPPLISEEARATMGEVLDLRSDTVLDGATHYTMMFDPHAATVAHAIRDFLQEIG
jgi:pimeloyl-ACP methyl ester carboxylesterase